MQRRQFLEGVGGASLALLFANACGDSGSDASADAGDDGENGATGNGTSGDSTGGGNTGASGSTGDASTTDGGGTSAGTTGGQDAGMTLPDAGAKQDAGANMGAACAAAIVAQISCRHDHKLEISAQDLAAGIQKKYDIKGTNATHGHEVTVTAAHFAALKRGETVMIFVDSPIQPHNVYLSCAADWKPAALDSKECK